MTQGRFIFAVMLLLSGAVNAADGVRFFQGRGVVRELRLERKEVVIKHEAIPNYLNAMVMAFPVKDAGLFEGVAVGDTVSFKLRVTDKEDRVEALKVIAQGVPSPPAAPALQQVKAGTVLDFKGIKLLDQAGKPFLLETMRGRPVALTFFFTRCAAPKMCPLLAANFAGVQQLLVAETAEAPPPLLVSVSIDPINDRPDVLGRYAQAYSSDPTFWRLATGELAQINRLALLCGIDFWDEKGTLTHTTRTLVIRPDGTVFRVFRDNKWSPREMVRALRRAAERQP
jgi:protein SCO1